MYVLYVRMGVRIRVKMHDVLAVNYVQDGSHHELLLKFGGEAAVDSFLHGMM